MSLSIKIGVHAVDVTGPIGEVWKVLEVFQRLSGFDPRTRDSYDDNREAMIRQQQIQAQQQMLNPTYIYPAAGAVQQPTSSPSDPYANGSAFWKALTGKKP